jgi:type I restriction enzyme S subunit
MSELTQYKVRDVIDIKRGYAFSSEDYRQEGIAILRVTNIQESGQIDDDYIFLESRLSDQYKNYLVESDDILLVMVGATTGKLGYVRSKNVPALLNQNMWNLKPTSLIDKGYLKYKSSEIIEAYLSVAQGSARDFLKQGDFDKYSVKIHSDLAEQQKIAKILSAVDNLIEKTQTLIEKYTAIKQGMMADLFTRGIEMTTGDTPSSKGGKLRPSVEDAPELYKQTELGWVPKEWEVCSLKEKIEGDGFVQTGPFGSQLHSYEYVEAGVPVIMPQDIIEGVISFEKIAQITAGKANSLSRHKVKANDVVFSRRGDLTRSAYIANELNNIGFICGTGCLLLRVSTLIVHGGWFSTLYGTRFIQSQIDGLAVGTTMANLNSKILGKLKIAFPPVKEQEEAYLRIDLVDKKLKLLQREVEEHKKIKKGLMQDLLTGKVKVNG